MGKSLFIAEKPSVASEFAKVMGENLSSKEGYREGDHVIITWCYGHLVTMSYPEAYDESLKKWRIETLPFLPEQFKYEVINNPGTRKQFSTVKRLLNRPDVDTIYVCTDSGREGEYIYRLVRQEAGVSGKKERRVWINSQTENEIKRGIREAKDLSEYNALSDAAYLRAKEDYLMGINFSRLLSICYSRTMADFLHRDHCVISVGRVMTCVLGMVVQREREIRSFEKTPFYRVIALLGEGDDAAGFEWKAVEGSRYHASPLLYKENGFKKEEDAKGLIRELTEGEESPYEAKVVSTSRKKERKAAPLLYNLAELQNDCSKLFKIAPDMTLKIVQDLYEKKLVTYPRTDARVLSTAIAKEIGRNIRGLFGLPGVKPFAEQILAGGLEKKIGKSKYVNDAKITDHYAIIPTGQGLNALKKESEIAVKVYEVIVRRFLAIFFPPAVYRRTQITAERRGEFFTASQKVLEEQGYLAVMNYSFTKKKEEKKALLPEGLRKGSTIRFSDFTIKEGETSPPKRYTTGTMILAMENAGNLIEDEELREQIKGSGIGTSATRAEILSKLVKNDYIAQNPKTQILTPTLQGEMIFYIVYMTIRPLLSPKLTAGWEKGLTQVADGSLSTEEYMEKLVVFIREKTENVKRMGKQNGTLREFYSYARPFYKKEKKGKEKEKQEKEKGQKGKEKE